MRGASERAGEREGGREGEREGKSDGESEGEREREGEGEGGRETVHAVERGVGARRRVTCDLWHWKDAQVLRKPRCG
eukprot:3442510-Rhodomonas_salina.1